ncbi:hypothetical protein M408DRAFT_198654 [Serendipita vermifera MAFF 305830]|uniref:Uncharacterized protein n=1 Tax=Serendipita vermifera MAFF 305830 TaxID=933852 RepID=A0A0C2X9X8_SERVB|nr:hypothetical protein M408DRAFT_198654 [Serendipita vermifera MAFF 305830]
MNVPLTSREAPCAAPTACFCGQICPPESYYCSLQCARVDAFNSLTLGKPHESSKPPMAPLPTLPPNFFKLPPKPAFHDADELVFMSEDHGPFQAQPSRTKKRKSRAPRRPVPRSSTSNTTSSVAGDSTASPSTSTKRSEWRSHYRHTQFRESLTNTSEIPSFLIDQVESSTNDQVTPIVVGVTPVEDADALALPVLTEPRLQGQQDQQGTDLVVRIGSFGIVTGSYPSLTCTEADTLTPYDYTTDASKRHTNNQRSSASSYNSLSTSGTSRSSFTSVTGSSDRSPTRSLYRTSFSKSQPRLGYGSAFGGHDEVVTLEVAKMVAQAKENLLMTKRASRKRSSTDATARPGTCEENTQQGMEPPVVDSQPPAVPLKDAAAIRVPPRKVASTTVPKSHWPHFGAPITSRSEQRLPLVAPTPSHLRATEAPPSRPIPGTVVKTTTIASKGRLPIGTPHPVPPRPKTPSNVLPAGINLSLSSRSFCAPAYAMSAPKIPVSTRPLRTSPSKKSLKTQKEDSNAKADQQALEESFKPSFEPMAVAQAEDSRGVDVLVVNELDVASSAQTGSRFTLSNPPKPQRETKGPPTPPKDSPDKKSHRPTLSLVDPALFIPPSTHLDVTPRPSPMGEPERSPSTAGGPLTPRATPLGSGQRPAWLLSPTDTFNKASRFMSSLHLQRNTRIGSNGKDLSPSADDDTVDAQASMAQRMKFQTSFSPLRIAV